MAKPFNAIRISVCLLMLFGGSEVIYAQCPPCYKNFDPEQRQMGQIGGPPAPDGSGRRVLKIRIDSSWDVDANGNSTPGRTNSNIWNAVQGCDGCIPSAAQMWNDQRDGSTSNPNDPRGWPTAYYFQVDQRGDYTPDFIIMRADPANSDACASVSKAGPPYIIKLPDGTDTFSPEIIAGRIAHELGHPIGIANTRDCISIMNGSRWHETHGDWYRTSNQVTPQDVKASNDNLDPTSAL